MSPSGLFFLAKHETLRNNYRDGSGLSTDSCMLVALEIADLLRDEGHVPRILSLRGEEVNPAVCDRAELVPSAYGGAVTWGTHLVCEAAGVVYDPMLPRPMPLQEYLAVAFAQQVEIESCPGLLK